MFIVFSNSYKEAPIVNTETPFCKYREQKSTLFTTSIKQSANYSNSTAN